MCIDINRKNRSVINILVCDIRNIKKKIIVPHMNYGLKKGGGDQVLVLQKRINYKENFKLLLLIIVQTFSLRCVLIQHIIFGFCAYIHTYHRNYQLTSFKCHGLSNCEASVIHRYG